MPIRPENRDRYPKNWKSEVVPRIRERSGNRCECIGECGVQHNPHADLDDPDLFRCGKLNGMPIDEIEGPKIVLTVGHMNHQPEDCRDENLRHWCQGCHNRYDAPMRRAGIQARAHAQRASADLFQCQETT